MRRLLILALAVVSSSCASVLPAGHKPNTSTASFVAHAPVEVVLDSLEATLRSDPCLAMHRERDSLGTATLIISHGCSGGFNRAQLRVVEQDGVTTGRVRSVFIMESAAYVDLATLVLSSVTATELPVYVHPTTPSADAGCWTYTDWLASLDAAAPPLPAGPLDEQAPEMIGGLTGLARAIQYPNVARRSGVEGRTLVRFVVDETGTVVCPEAIVSQDPTLDQAAVSALRATRFTQGTQGGRPVSVRFTVPILFRIE